MFAVGMLCVVTGVLLITSVAHAGRYLGKPFPEFAFTDAITGEETTLASLRGKVVLAHFWRSGNQACAAELVHIKRAYTSYHDQGFEIVNVSLDDNAVTAREFILLKGIPGRHAAEGGGWDTRLATEFAVTSVPELFVLDHAGVCVADSVRGSSLPRAISRAVREIPDAVRALEDPRVDEQNPSVVKSLEDRIGDARATIDAASAPLAAMNGQLDEIVELLDWVEGQYPRPDRTQLIRVRFQRLCALMGSVRHELFVRGYLNDRAIPVPSDPFPENISEPTTAQLDAVHAQLESTRRSAVVLRLAMSGTWGEIEEVRKDLREIARRLGWSRGDLHEITGKVIEIEDDVNGIRERTTDPWLRQMTAIESVLGRLAGGDSKLLERVAKIDERLEYCKNRLPIATRRASAYVEVRNAYAEVRDGLISVVDELVERGMLTGGAVAIPADPFARGVQLDARTRMATEVVLDETRTALTIVKGRLGASETEVAGLRERLDALRTALEEHPKDAGTKATVEAGFRALCDEVLAMMDAMG
jgi:hypothetical protein